MVEDREDRIRERAYKIWEEQGRPHGRHEDHWRQASQETGEDLFGEGSNEALDRPGGLDGGLLPQGGLVAGGGPGGAGIGGLGVAGEPANEEEERRQRG
jgi:hypothetical protein